MMGEPLQTPQRHQSRTMVMLLYVSLRGASSKTSVTQPNDKIQSFALFISSRVKSQIQGRFVHETQADLAHASTQVTSASKLGGENIWPNEMVELSNP